MLNEDNVKIAQQLSNALQLSRSGVVTDREWIIATVQKRKNLVAGSLSLTTSLVIFTAKVIKRFDLRK